MPEAVHQVYFPSNVNVITAFIDQSKLSNLPKTSIAFETSGFIVSLLRKIVSFANPGHFTSQQNRVFEVLLDELSILNQARLFFPPVKMKE